MKYKTLAIAALLLALSGCNLGQTFSCSRPNIFSRLYDRIHGNNVGAPCMSGTCASPMAAAPVVADSGCDGCSGTTSMGYENYEGESYAGPVVGTQVYGGENVVPVRP